MSFFLYYFFHILLTFGILALFIYLIFKIFRGSNKVIKLMGLLAFIILSNFPVGKYALSIVYDKIGTYHYRSCDDSVGFNSNVIEHEWRGKQKLLEDFVAHEKTYHREHLHDALYRTFDFKWWMFWEYYTYYSSDVYELPLLPKECEKNIVY